MVILFKLFHHYKHSNKLIAITEFEMLYEVIRRLEINYKWYEWKTIFLLGLDVLAVVKDIVKVEDVLNFNSFLGLPKRNQIVFYL